MRWEKSLRWFGVAKRNPLENTNEAGEKFEMIWCGKEKAIEEYKVKACAVDVGMFTLEGKLKEVVWVGNISFNHEKDDNRK
jgi:hypothetical protein